jgi:hypothetical protein
MSLPIREFLKPYGISESVYVIPSDIFGKLDVKTWKYNRPPTESRIAEIREWNQKSNRMDGLLNLAYVTGTGLVCFEGNHRRLAVEGLGIPVISNIVWDVTDEFVMQEFRRINMSVSVPELYIVEQDHSLKNEIMELVSSYRKKYRDHEVSSARPNRPNFNRDGLTDLITRLQKETGLSVRDLAERLHTLNHLYATSPKTKMGDKIIEKCQKSGLWLFSWSTSLSAKDLY